MSGESAELAEFATAVTIDALPNAARERAAQHLALMIEAAAASAPPAPLLAALLALEAPRSCTLLFSGGRTGAVAAAHLNAATVADSAVPFDTRQAAAVVVPACLAAAELAERSGADLICGVAVGLEATLRLATALGSRHEARGFTLLGSAGRIGAAVGAARALGARSNAVLAAIGFAATQGAGPLRSAAAIGPALGAKAAADGVEAALFGAAGLIGPPEPLEGRRGLFALEFADDPTALTDDLGARWLLGEVPVAEPAAQLFAASLALGGEGTVQELLSVARV